MYLVGGGIREGAIGGGAGAIGLSVLFFSYVDGLELKL